MLRRRLSVAAAASALALTFAGCSMPDGTSPLDVFGQVVQTGQEWWDGTSEQLQNLGSAIQGVVAGIDLSAVGDQVLALCTSIHQSSRDSDSVDSLARSMIRHATGFEPAEGQVRDLITTATAHCPAE